MTITMLDKSSLESREGFTTLTEIERSSHPRAVELASRSAKSERGSADLATSCDAFVVPQHAAKPFAADDLLVIGERLMVHGPSPAERPIVERLMRTQQVAKLCVARYEVIEGR